MLRIQGCCMEQYIIAIPLPEAIQDEIGSICYGLPNIEWVDPPSLHITLKHLGKLSPISVKDLKLELENFEFSIFKTNFQGIEVKHNRRRNGSFKIHVINSEAFEELSKEIDKKIRKFSSQSSKHIHRYNTIMGYYQNLHPEKILDFLESNGGFCSSPFTVDSIAIMSQHTTPKHTYFNIDEVIPFEKTEETSTPHQADFTVPRSYLPRK